MYGTAMQGLLFMYFAILPFISALAYGGVAPLRVR